MFNWNICKIWSQGLFILGVFVMTVGLSLIQAEKILIMEWELVSVKSVSFTMSVLVDWISCSFLGLVLLISSMVIFYSADYMSGDKTLERFIGLVLLFVTSMMFLIISPNLVSILLGWDGLGLVSYCLVIYYQNEKSGAAGMLTALSNRVGDVAILMSLAWFVNFGDFNYIYYQELLKFDVSYIYVSYFLVLAAMTKSAQIPFSAWLPAAMAAPTPVSALVHSSTLVTAGVYLMVRFSNLLFSSESSYVLLLLGTLTMFMSGIGANLEYDLKKIIALSTLSQLGLMMSVASLGYPILCYFHLLCHAMFKALLFMCAGVFIHGVLDNQDIRNMGSFFVSYPFSSVSFYVSNMALCGAPFLSGFYSKDLILEMGWMSGVNSVIVGLFFISTGLTVMYTVRLIWLTMGGWSMCASNISLSDTGANMINSMTFMTYLSVIGGSFFSWLLFPCSVFIYLNKMSKFSVILVSVLGAWLILNMLFMVGEFLKSSMILFYGAQLGGSMWFLPFISTWGVSFNFLFFGEAVGGSMDQGWSEYYGGQAFLSFVLCLSRYLHNLMKLNVKMSFMVGLMWVLVIFNYFGA